MLQPHDSALFVLARTINADAVAEAFKGFGGTVLRTTLTAPSLLMLVCISNDMIRSGCGKVV